ncbi:MAG: (d)CMP kinase [Phycisphaerales bacterium]
MHASNESSCSSGISSCGDAFIVTIDGPAGTGKSTLARRLADRLGFRFLDTGAMYRAAALIAIEQHIARDAHDDLVRAIKGSRIRFDFRSDEAPILIDERPVGSRIREHDVTSQVSHYATVAPLRRIMADLQRDVARECAGIVTEGRDQGSVVFPDAACKIYLTADSSVRARRRLLELESAGRPADFDSILHSITERDLRDMTRIESPLVRPEGSTLLDTSSLSVDEALDALDGIVRTAMCAHNASIPT